MPNAEFRLFLDNEAADAATLARFGEIHVDQAIGMASEAELHMDLSVNEEGLWNGMEDTFVQPGARVRVEIKIGETGEFVPLIDGPIVGNRFELSADVEGSKLIVVVQDDSVLLNRDEAVELFEDKRADEIASQLFEDFGLEAEVDAMPDAGAAVKRYIVQRGTAMQLLRELARNHGAYLYVKPGTEPGTSVGVFKYPSWEPSALPELLLLGEQRNVASFRAEVDATRPLAATAYSVGATDKTVIGSTLTEPDIEALGDEGAHTVLAPAQTLLSRTREEQSDLDEAVFAAVNLSTFAYSASGEVTSDGYEGVMQPYQVVAVAGIGGYLSGDYLISRVAHVVTDGGYQQKFELKRNARSAGSGASSDPLGGIF
ncbi:MAG TPA: hypothetical protein VJS66_09660 [Burkholderiales bacterium]|nr:hypothetical protein [Burkholderiales bacterium]